MQVGQEGVALSPHVGQLDGACKGRRAGADRGAPRRTWGASSGGCWSRQQRPAGKPRLPHLPAARHFWSRWSVPRRHPAPPAGWECMTGCQRNAQPPAPAAGPPHVPPRSCRPPAGSRAGRRRSRHATAGPPQVRGGLPASASAPPRRRAAAARPRTGGARAGGVPMPPSRPARLGRQAAVLQRSRRAGEGRCRVLPVAARAARGRWLSSGRGAGADQGSRRCGEWQRHPCWSRLDLSCRRRRRGGAPASALERPAIHCLAATPLYWFLTGFTAKG